MSILINTYFMVLNLGNEPTQCTLLSNTVIAYICTEFTQALSVSSYNVLRYAFVRGLIPEGIVCHFGETVGRQPESEWMGNWSI